MGLTPEKPTSTDDSFGITRVDDGHNFKCIIRNMDLGFDLFEIKDCYGTVIAEMKWTGVYMADSKVKLQPYIVAAVPLSVCYDGQFIGVYGTDAIVNPRPGCQLFYSAGEDNYFNHSGAGTSPTKEFNLNANNSSIRMDNISLFHQGMGHGAMLDFRASFQDVNSIVILSSRLCI